MDRQFPIVPICQGAHSEVFAQMTEVVLMWHNGRDDPIQDQEHETLW